MVVARRESADAVHALEQARGYLSSQQFELSRSDWQVVSVEEAIG
jgi:hypothetical protein